MLPTRRLITNSLLKRSVHSKAELVENCSYIRNRNPRNLERLRIGRKFAGFQLEKVHKPYWHKLVIKPSNRYVNAEVQHFQNGPVITASTGEKAIKLQLYRCTDTSAYINLGRVLAQRCLESGICEMELDPTITMTSKVNLFLEEFKKAGVILEEPERYIHPTPWGYERPEKSWEYYE